MPDNFGIWSDLVAAGLRVAADHLDVGGGGAGGPSGDPTMSATRRDLPVQQAVLGQDRDGTYDWNPFPDADDLPAYGGRANGCNLQVMVAPQQKVINKAPRGYVIVEDPQNPGIKVAMLKAVAKSCGLWKPRANPFFTASEAKTIRKAARRQRKGDRLAKMLNSSCGTAPLRRSRGKR